MNEEKILWQSKTNKTQIIVRFITTILVVTFLVIMFSSLFSSMTQSPESRFYGRIIAVLPIIILLLFFAYYLYGVSIPFTVEYIINEHQIEYKWGLFKKKNANITIDNIKKVTLVNFRNKKYSTLYIETFTPTNALAFDFVSGKKRASPTMEKVNDGKVALLIIEQLMSSKRS